MACVVQPCWTKPEAEDVIHFRLWTPAKLWLVLCWHRSDLVFQLVTRWWKLLYFLALSYPFAQIQYIMFLVVVVFMKYLMDAYNALWITANHVFLQKLCKPSPHACKIRGFITCKPEPCIISYKLTSFCRQAKTECCNPFEAFSAVWIISAVGVTTPKLKGHCLTLCLNLTYQ